MSKVHEDNAGYVGVSHEETQDPYFSYNKLSLPLSESDKTVIRNEETFTVTVAGGKFIVNGVSQASLSLAEGGVYTFDQSDSSNGGHPLRFSDTEDGTHGGGQEYTLGVTIDGTPGQSGAQTKIVVPFGAPDLYYYCSVHSGMGSSAVTPANRFMFDGALPILKTTDAFGETLGTGNNEDPYASNLVLAVPMAGGNFNDIHADIKGSGTNKSVDISGVTSASQSRLYGSSGEFLGATDHLQFYGTARDNTPDFAFAANEDFTVEAWIWWDSDNQTGNTGSIVADYYEGSSNTSPNWQFTRRASQGIGLWWNNSGTTVSVAAPNYSVLNKVWNHVVLQREGSTFKFFVNGKLVASFSDASYSNAIGRGRSLWVGIDANETSEDFSGYIQDLRVYKGVAKYASDFTPPDRINLLDLSGNNNNARNEGVTWQTSISKFYGGAANFDDTTLLVEEATDFDFSGDWCFETWYYASEFATTGGTVNLICSTEALDRFQIYNSSDYSFRMFFDGSVVQASANTLGHNAWHHIAATREGSTIRLFVDGSVVATGTNTASVDLNNLYIGNQYRNGAPRYHTMKAKLQDLRIYNGHAKYTSSFSPPERSVKGTARRYPSGIYVVS